MNRGISLSLGLYSLVQPIPKYGKSWELQSKLKNCRLITRMAVLKLRYPPLQTSSLSRTHALVSKHCLLYDTYTSPPMSLFASDAALWKRLKEEHGTWLVCRIRLRKDDLRRAHRHGRPIQRRREHFTNPQSRPANSRKGGSRRSLRHCRRKHCWPSIGYLGHVADTKSNGYLHNHVGQSGMPKRRIYSQHMQSILQDGAPIQHLSQLRLPFLVWISTLFYYHISSFPCGICFPSLQRGPLSGNSISSWTHSLHDILRAF